MIWGITGCVGAGKSTVTAILAGFGARVLDVDDVAAQALRESALGLNAAQALHAIVTNSPDRARIKAALVPVVQRHVEAWADQSAAFGVIDAATLFEYGLDRCCDFTLCVCCPIEQRRERVLVRSTASAGLFDAIEASQLPEAEKATRSSATISGTLAPPILAERLSKLLQHQTQGMSSTD